MFHQVTSYFKFLLRAGNAHGVHSPFVYDLITRCFYDRKQYPAYDTLKEHRNTLLADATALSITEFGAGSRVFKNNERTVHAMVKNVGISRKRQQLLFRLSLYYKPQSVLELGTSLGMGTMALALGAPSAAIITVEGCPETSAIAKKYFDAFDAHSVGLKTSTFDQYFQQTSGSPWDMVYIDGNHSKEATLQIFESLVPFTHNDSVLIFDDIYWSLGMTEAWREIKARPEVTVSIDTFQWGLVFFRREQPKQHFRIRV